MKPRKADDAGVPRPEQLAAYADGELDSAALSRVETWLARHPEAAAEAEALRRVSRLYQGAAPPEPAERDWAGTFARVEAGLAATRIGPRWWRRLGWVTGGAAAALLLALLLHRPQPDSPSPPVPEPAEPLPMASAADVEILSMDDADAGLLVVGEPPVPGPLILASAGDVTLEKVQPDTDGMVPPMPAPQASSDPMILWPAAPNAVSP